MTAPGVSFRVHPDAALCVARWLLEKYEPAATADRDRAERERNYANVISDYLMFQMTRRRLFLRRPVLLNLPPAVAGWLADKLPSRLGTQSRFRAHGFRPPLIYGPLVGFRETLSRAIPAKRGRRRLTIAEVRQRLVCGGNIDSSGRHQKRLRARLRHYEASF